MRSATVDFPDAGRPGDHPGRSARGAEVPRHESRAAIWAKGAILRASGKATASCPARVVRRGDWRSHVARNVYVTALEPGSGKSAVVLGLTEVLSRRAGRLGYFRPLIGSGSSRDADVELVLERFRLAQSYRESYALTLGRPARRRRPQGPTPGLLERVLDGYRTVADGSASPRAADRRRGGRAVGGGRRRGDRRGRPGRRTSWSSRAATSRPASLAVELDLNVDAANHLGAPVLLVVNGAQADGRAGARPRSARASRRCATAAAR